MTRVPPALVASTAMGGVSPAPDSRGTRRPDVPSGSGAESALPTEAPSFATGLSKAVGPAAGGASSSTALGGGRYWEDGFSSFGQRSLVVANGSGRGGVGGPEGVRP